MLSKFWQFIPDCITEQFFSLWFIEACESVAVSESSRVTCMRNRANAVSKPFIFCRWSWLLVLLTSTDNKIYLSSQIHCISVTFRVPLSSQNLTLVEGILLINYVAPFSDWHLELLRTSFIPMFIRWHCRFLFQCTRVKWWELGLASICSWKGRFSNVRFCTFSER